MSGYKKVSGAWNVLTPYGKNGGVWKRAKEAYVKNSGVWKRWWLDGGLEDTIFAAQTNTAINSRVDVLKVLSDDSLLIGGPTLLNGTTISDNLSHFFKVNSTATSLDTTFNNNLGTGFNDAVYTIATQSDGKILVGGQFTALDGTTRNRLVRLNSSGTLDTSFYTNLGTGFSGGAVNIVTVQSDGKILVGGAFTSLNGTTRNRLVRLNSDGTLDTSFYTNLGTGFNGAVRDIGILSTGKIIVAGLFTTLNGTTRNYLVALNSDGTVDTTFYTNLGTSFSGGIGYQLDSGRQVGIQSTDKIVVVGSFTSFNGLTRNRILRLNADGTEDSTFYTNTGTGYNWWVAYVKIQSDNKIIVGGDSRLNSTNTNTISRLNADGTHDSTFTTNIGSGNGAGNGIPYPHVAHLIDTQSTGSVVFATRTVIGMAAFDTSEFGDGSSGSLFFGLRNIQNTTTGTIYNRAFLYRVSSDGSIDTSFGSENGGVSTIIHSAVMQSTGKIVIGGSFLLFGSTRVNRCMRFNTDGTRDTAFTTSLGTGFDHKIYSLAVQSDDKIIVGGLFISLNGTTRNRLVRLNSDGTLDTSFYTNLGTSFNSGVYIVTLQSDGKILVGGAFTSLNGTTRNRLVRLNSDGTLDTSFYTNLGTSFGNNVCSIAVQSDGKILVGGQFTTLNGATRNRLVRLNSDGTEDTSFYTNLGTGLNNDVYAITVQPDGKILVGGQFTTLNSTTRNRFVRLNSDGTVDTSFYTNLGTAFSSSTQYIASIVCLPNNKILIGGEFSSFNSNIRYGLVRLNADGTEDSTFFSNSSGTTTYSRQFNRQSISSGDGLNSVRGMYLKPNGDLILAGRFRTYKNSPRSSIIIIGGG